MKIMRILLASLMALGASVLAMPPPSQSQNSSTTTTQQTQINDGRRADGSDPHVPG